MCFAASSLFPAIGKIAYTAWGINFDMEGYNKGQKDLKEYCKMINTHLGDDKEWLACGRLTLADLSMFAPLSIGFGLVLDAGFRKAMPNLTRWFTKLSKLPSVVKTAGYVRMCEKPIKPVDPSKVQKVESKAPA